MTRQPRQQKEVSLGEDVKRTAVAPMAGAVALHRSRSRLNVYGGEFRLARAVLDVIAGVDPGAVRLAQTLLGLIPGRHAAPRDPTPSRRGGAGPDSRGAR